MSQPTTTQHTSLLSAVLQYKKMIMKKKERNARKIVFCYYLVPQCPNREEEKCVIEADEKMCKPKL